MAGSSRGTWIVIAAASAAVVLWSCSDANRNRTGGGDSGGTNDAAGEGGPGDASDDADEDSGTSDAADAADSLPMLACDPIAQDDCAAGEACYYNPDISDVMCAPEGTEDEGAFCDEELGCRRGMICQAGTCTKMCDLETDEPCAE